MRLTRLMEPGSDPLLPEEESGLAETVLSKCEAYLRHEGLLSVISGVGGAPADKEEISAGLLAVLRGKDDLARERLVGALVSSIGHREGKITVKFKIPRESGSGTGDVDDDPQN